MGDPSVVEDRSDLPREITGRHNPSRSRKPYKSRANRKSVWAREMVVLEENQLCRNDKRETKRSAKHGLFIFWIIFTSNRPNVLRRSGVPPGTKRLRTAVKIDLNCTISAKHEDIHLCVLQL
jgi:hypothetical protein